jgi:hypothetical protein
MIIDCQSEKMTYLLIVSATALLCSLATVALVVFVYGKKWGF